ncbi:tyrosine-type recombinase/integrase [Kitasatospora sp. NPDC059327]|uniref:tyrosine-type recombinase/integrase n=1 Tax=Kitasatospora sp. NPDC059327 TaxID=3346803 RepID=UPI00367B3453
MLSLRARLHQQAQEKEKEKAGSGWVDTGPGLHPARRSPHRACHFNALLRRAQLRQIRFHDLRRSTATLLLEQGVELVVIKELLGHTHIGVTATVYAHVRLRLQRDAIDLLSRTLGEVSEAATRPDDGNDLPLCAAPARRRCRQPTPVKNPEASPEQ